MTNGDCFIYGGGLTAAFETYLTDRVMLLLQVKERPCSERMRVISIRR